MSVTMDRQLRIWSVSTLTSRSDNGCGCIVHPLKLVYE